MMTQSNTMTDEALIRFAHQLADIARDIAKAHFLDDVNIETKADLSPVTIADRAIEQALRERIQNEFPDHSITGEEFESVDGASEYQWTIDPIDGTQSFVCGVPLFGTLIALTRASNPLLGIIDMPMLAERYYSITSTEQPACAYKLSADQTTAVAITTSECRELTKARLFAAHPDMFNTEQKRRFERLKDTSMISRYSADCYAYALLASGHIDLVAEADMKPYDFQALIPIVLGAGGVITDWNNQPLSDIHQTSTVLASANEDLHKKALQVLAD